MNVRQGDAHGTHHPLRPSRKEPPPPPSPARALIEKLRSRDSPPTSRSPPSVRSSTSRETPAVSCAVKQRSSWLVEDPNHATLNSRWTVRRSVQRSTQPHHRFQHSSGGWKRARRTSDSAITPPALSLRGRSYAPASAAGRGRVSARRNMPAAPPPPWMA